MKYKLKEICIKVTDGSHFSPKAQDKGYPMFSVKDMLEYGFDYSNCKRISKEDFIKMQTSGCVPEKDDVLVAKDGSYLKEIFVCNETKEEAILSSIAIFRPNQEIITPDFLCYLLKSPKVYNYIATNCVSGSALPRIVLKTFKEVELEVPDKIVQEKITSVLKDIDTKIKTNIAINRNLEEQAQALFKAWFVDFEPFGGNMPSDWKIGKLGDVAAISTKAFNPTKSDTVEIEHYSIPAYDEKHYPVFECSDDIKSNKYYVTKTSVIVSKLNPDTKRIWRPYCITNIPICSTEFIVYQPKNEQYRDWIYSIVDSDQFTKYLCSHVVGSTNSRQRAVPKATLDFEICIPKETIIKEFCSIVTPIYNMIEKNVFSNQGLSQLRNTLLPKLMSGELDVSEFDI